MKRYRYRCVKARQAVSRKGGCTHYAPSCKTLALPLPLGERIIFDVDCSLRNQCQDRETLPTTNVNSTPKNVDDARTKDNIVFVQQSIEESYKEKSAVVAHLDEEINEKPSILTQTNTDLAKKQIVAENRESELTTEIAKLKKENEEAAERNAALEQKVQEIYPLRKDLHKTQNELGSLKAMYQKVLDFIESLNLVQKLQEFLKQKTRTVKR